MNNTPKHDYAALVAETVYAEMLLSAKAAAMPQSFVDGIRLKAESATRFIIENVWEEDGEPLAIFFEHGTVDHWVRPRPGGTLAFPKPAEGSQRHGKAIFFKSHKPNAGDVVFSKGHYVSGLPSLMPMHIGFKIGISRMRERLKNGV